MPYLEPRLGLRYLFGRIPNIGIDGTRIVAAQVEIESKV